MSICSTMEGQRDGSRDAMNARLPDTESEVSMPPQYSLFERFWSKVDRSGGPDACWPWLACYDPRPSKGYGRFSLRRRGLLAHRVAYELLVGPIPDGLTIDHLCRTPLCVNPAHLEPVTHRVNCLRGVGVGTKNIAKIQCIRGHRFTAVNTYLDGRGHRQCWVCLRFRWRRKYYRRKARRLRLQGGER